MLRRLLSRWPAADVPRSDNVPLPTDDEESSPSEDPSVSIVRLVSSSGGTVFADPGSFELSHIPGDRTTRPVPLLALVPAADPTVLFLSAADGTGALIRAEGAPGEPTLVFRLQGVGEGGWALKNPDTSLFLSAADVAPRALTIPCNRTAAGGWETFSLEPVTDLASVPPSLQAIGRFFASAPTEERLFAWLEREDEAALAPSWRAVLRAMPPAFADRLAERLAADPALRRRLASLGGEDRWLGQSFRALSAWLDDRAAPGELILDEHFDLLGTDIAMSGDKAGSSVRLLTGLRATAEPRHALAIVATAGNDGIQLLEWIAHHRALGVDHFFFYLNGSDDGSAGLLRALAAAGRVTLVEERHAPGVNANRKVLTHAFSFLPQTLDYRWTLVMDVDEFVVLDTRRHASLPAFLEARAAGGANAVALSRFLFRPGPEILREPSPVISRFRRRYAHPFTTVKTISVTRDHVSSLPHDPIPRAGATGAYHDSAGRPHHWPGRRGNPSEGRPIFEDAWINIYMTKSIEEFLWHRCGGHTVLPENFSGPELVGHIRSVCDEPLEEDGRICAHLPGLDAELRALRALPDVAEAERFIWSVFRERVEAIKRALAATMQADPILRAAAATWLPTSSDASVPRAA